MKPEILKQMKEAEAHIKKLSEVTLRIFSGLAGIQEEIANQKLSQTPQQTLNKQPKKV